MVCSFIDRSGHSHPTNHDWQLYCRVDCIELLEFFSPGKEDRVNAGCRVRFDTRDGALFVPRHCRGATNNYQRGVLACGNRSTQLAYHFRSRRLPRCAPTADRTRTPRTGISIRLALRATSHVVQGDSCSSDNLFCVSGGGTEDFRQLRLSPIFPDKTVPRLPQFHYPVYRGQVGTEGRSPSFQSAHRRYRTEFQAH